MDIVPGLPRWVALFAGSEILSHLLYFIRGEHHIQAVKLAQLSVLIPIILFSTVLRFGRFNLVEASLTTFTLVSAYWASLITSMLIYRNFFHRLGLFPGPPLAKLSKFWHVAQLGPLDNYKRLDRWYSQYGDFVRIGPGELSVIHPDGVEGIMGAKSTCTKAPLYDGGNPLISMHQCRDRALHDKKRRVWDRAFSLKALEGYEPRVKRFDTDLVEQVESFGGKPLNASLWFNYYSFDVMGQLALGNPFNMLKNRGEEFCD